MMGRGRGVAWLLPILQSQYFKLFPSWATVGENMSTLIGAVALSYGDYSQKILL